MTVEQADAGRPVYQFTIRLTQIKPLIWRRFQILDTATFWELHVAIQDVLGWENHGFHRFYARHGETRKIKRIGFLDETLGLMPFAYSWATKLSDYVDTAHRVWPYSCPLEHAWDFSIVLEAMLTRDLRQTYPACIDGAGQAPPQVCREADIEPSWWRRWLPPQQARRYRRVMTHLGYDALDGNTFSKGSVVFSHPMQALKQMGITIQEATV